MARYMTDEELYDAGYHVGRGKSVVDEISRMAQERERAAQGGGTPGGISSGNAASGNAAAGNDAFTQQAEENAYARYLRQAEEAAEAQRAAEQAARREQYNLSRSNVNTAADEALRQAYIRKRQQMAQMPQQNALIGNGGLSETAMMQLEADYGKNRANLEAERLAQLGNLETQLNEGLAIDEGNYYARLQNIKQQQAEADMERELAMKKAENSSETYNAAKTPTLTFSQANSLLKSGVYSPNAMTVWESYTGMPYRYEGDEEAKYQSYISSNASRILSAADPNVIRSIDNVLRRYGDKNDPRVQNTLAMFLSRGRIDEETIDAWNASR